MNWALLLIGLGLAGYSLAVGLAEGMKAAPDNKKGVRCGIGFALGVLIVIITVVHGVLS